MSIAHAYQKLLRDVLQVRWLIAAMLVRCDRDQRVASPPELDVLDWRLEKLGRQLRAQKTPR